MMPVLMTADELLHANVPDKRTELVRGVLVVREPAGYNHGRVAVNLTVRLGAHVDLTGAGQLVAAETGFTLSRDPDTVRAPDVGFIASDRVPAPGTNGFPELAPDLVVEVLSPDDRPGGTLAKVGDWLDAGTRLVWVIDPDRRSARVYRADGSETALSENDALNGEDVLPGFVCRLSAVL
jgi:Uma2 family endonuclease